jgi:hypothetical protein
MPGQRLNLQCAYILSEVERVRMVSRMAGDCVWIVVDTGNHLGAFLSVDFGMLNTSAGASGAAE